MRWSPDACLNTGQRQLVEPVLLGSGDTAPLTLKFRNNEPPVATEHKIWPPWRATTAIVWVIAQVAKIAGQFHDRVL
jgi:hypothetical protein